MNKITLYHGTPDKIVVPTFGKGEKNTTTDEAFILPKAQTLQKNGQFADQMKQTAMFINMNLIQKGLKFQIFKKKVSLRGLQN